MAGIGFELKKAFAKKGVLNLFKAYAMSGVVVTGPMFLSISLLAGLRLIFDHAGVTMTPERLMMNGLITYTTLFSVVWVNSFALVVVRYVADVLYTEEYEKVMPSFFGSVTMLLGTGEILYGVFLYFMRIPLYAAVPALILFGIYVIVWMQINYLSAIKNYMGILLAFFAAVICGLIAGWAIVKVFGGDLSYAVMLAVIIAYGILSVCYHVLLSGFFPRGKGSAFAFLKHLEKHRELVITGICLQVALYGHIVIMWFSPAGQTVAGGLRQCALYDMPAMLAFLTCIITIINITTSLEVNFYPYYFRYIRLINGGGSITELKKAERLMKRTLFDEIFYCLIKQFFVTLICIVFGSLILNAVLPGITPEMTGIFRVLCVGYALYASGYALLLVLMYFDYRLVYVSLLLYAVSTTVLGIRCAIGDARFYGAGFVIGGMVFLVATFTALYSHLRDILLHLFVGQQMVKE